jgi:hypothetical protein
VTFGKQRKEQIEICEAFRRTWYESFQDAHRANLRARRVPGNLRSLKPKSSHQAFLAEEENIDAFLQRGARERSRHTGIDYDQARCRPDFPASAFVKMCQ